MSKAVSSGFEFMSGGGYVAGLVVCRHGSGHAQRAFGALGRRRHQGVLAGSGRSWVPERTLVGRRYRYGKGGRR